MLLGERFTDFVAGSPISVMMRGIIEQVFDADRIDELFEREAEVQYTRELRFSTVADLMSAVVFDIAPSIGAAYQHIAEEINVSRKSVYNKLNGVEPQVSAAMVDDSLKHFREIIAELKPPAKPLLKGYRAKVLDGNHFAATEHRLEELRSLAAGPLPGKALVVYEPEVKLATAVIPCEDGHAQERSLLDRVVPLVADGDLWIADRNFSTTAFLFAIAERRASFVIRQHGNLVGELLDVRRHVGSTDTGEVYEQGIEITHPDTGARLRLRRISVELFKKTRDGERELHLLSNLPQKIPAVTIADVYRKRWTIETMFQELTETLSCEIKTLAYPKAAVFAFCLALVAYNAISVIIAAMEAVHGFEEVSQNVSRYYIALEIATTYAGMMIAIPNKHWTVFAPLSSAQMAALLRELAQNIKLSKYQKHPRGPKKKQPKRTTGTSPHVSTARILMRRKS